MNFTHYPCQAAAIKHGAAFLESARNGSRQAYEGPTGIGKSVVELEIQRLMGVNEYPIITPRVEIAIGMAVKLGCPSTDPEDLNIWTPIKYRNRLLAGLIQPPKGIIWDELHHHESESWNEIDLLTGCPPAIGFTASYFRGTPRSTKSFHDHWGDPITIATWSEAAALGYIKLPRFEVLPLVNDDIVEVVNGEFQVTSLEAHTVDRLGDLVNHCAPYHNGFIWDKATLFSVPSTAIARELAKRLNDSGRPAVSVTAETTDRFKLFTACEQRLIALVHVNVISEGVDLKLRRLVDLAPTLSPVKWIQQLGRIMRPTDDMPEYICTNRNVTRHAYVLKGAVPSSVIADQEKAFPPMTRAHVRVLGLESIGRFKPSAAPLHNGAKVHVYSLFAVIGTAVLEYCCLVPPVGDPIWACKGSETNRAETGNWGTWTRTDAPGELSGFQSKSPTTLTEKQLAWWKRAAFRHGLDAKAEVDGKAFQVLPVLKDLGLRIT